MQQPHAESAGRRRSPEKAMAILRTSDLHSPNVIQGQPGQLRAMVDLSTNQGSQQAKGVPRYLALPKLLRQP